MKLSGTFTVINLRRPTTRKGFSELQQHDVFKISMKVQNHNSFGRKHAVDCEVLINGNTYNYSLNEINLVFNQVIEVQQIN